DEEEVGLGGLGMEEGGDGGEERTPIHEVFNVSLFSFFHLQSECSPKETMKHRWWLVTTTRAR
ncbi:MAG: hypothetical protein ACK5TN_04825, partial [Acidobacteriota bacterium]